MRENSVFPDVADAEIETCREKVAGLRPYSSLVVNDHFLSLYQPGDSEDEPYPPGVRRQLGGAV